MLKQIVFFSTMFFLFMSISIVKAYTISGDTVYINDSKVYLSATPHTIYSSGWVYFNLTSKKYSGDVDAVWGFDTSITKPIRAEIYHPHWVNWTTNSSKVFYNISSLVDTTEECDFGHDYNLHRKKGNYTEFGGYDNTTNETIWVEKTAVVCYDSAENLGNGDYKIAWSTKHSRLENWSKLTGFKSVDHNFGGMNKWYYLKSATVEAGKTYMLRAYIKVPISLTPIGGKYWFAIKPSAEGIAEAISNGHLYYLDPWWNSSWQYRRNITINNTQNSNTLTDYQVAINISVSGWTNKPNSNFSDIRFVDSDDSTELSYWIEQKVDGSWASVWVKIPSIPASSTKDIYMYYGNPSATSESNGDAVFDFFDDFETLNETEWVTIDSSAGSATVSNSILDIVGRINDYRVMRNSHYLAPPHIWEWRVYIDAVSGGGYGAFIKVVDEFSLGSYNGSRDSITYWWYSGVSEWKICSSKEGTETCDTNNSVPIDGDYHIVKMISNTTDTYIYRDGESVFHSGSAYTPQDPMVFEFQPAGSHIYCDWVKARKYTDPEPTYSIGAEETSNIPPSINTPKTYDENYVEQTTFGSGDKVVIRVNVSDSDGANDIDKVLIEIIDNSSVVKISNETMVNVSSITDGYTYEYNYTLPVSPSGVWTINIYANDTKNDWGYNTTTFNLDVTSPSFTNWQQEPPDLNSSSMGKLYINVTITDDYSGVNDSSVKFYHWINDTQYPNQPWKFINGTAQEFEHEHTMINITPSIFNITLHTYAYNPSVFNVDPETMRSATKYNYSLNSNNKALKVRFYNISTNPNTTYILKPRLYRNSGNLLIYYCNNSYTNEKVYNSNYCVPLTTLTSQDEHYYQNVYFYGDENSYLDAVKITSTGYIIFYAIVGSDWEVEYANIDSNSVETSNNGGTTWSNQDFSANTWLIQINGNGLTTVGYKVYACDNVGNCGNSTVQEDSYAIADLPPSPAPKITIPENTTYAGIFNITWEPSKDPNSDPFNYSVYLYFSNGTLADVLADNNITEGTEYLEFDSTKYPNGQYYLIANATDINGNTNFYILPYYFTIISPIKVIQWVEFPWSNNTHVNISLYVWVFNNASFDISGDISVDVDENYTDYNITGGLSSGDFDLHSETKQWIRPADFDEWFNFSAVELDRNLGTSNKLIFILPVDPATKLKERNITLNQTFDITSTLNRQALTNKIIEAKIILSEIISKLLSFIRNLFHSPLLSLFLLRIQNVIRNIQSLLLITTIISKITDLTRTLFQSVTIYVTRQIQIIIQIIQSLTIAVSVSRTITSIRNVLQTLTVTSVLTCIRIKVIYQVISIATQIYRQTALIKAICIQPIISIIITTTAPVLKFFTLSAPPYALFAWFTSLENLVALFIALGGISTISLYFLWNKRKELWKHPFEKYKE